LLGRQGGYFFFVMATTMATIVEINTASNERAANKIVRTSCVVKLSPPLLGSFSRHPAYVVVMLLVYHLVENFDRGK
jgi:hypothetical protein